ncbi:MAG: hypothetical protein LC792_01080, partial [Actinobacteria bacterium]|nr:hypothetical protein [Actinomycetota bacterium]
MRLGRRAWHPGASPRVVRASTRAWVGRRPGQLSGEASHRAGRGPWPAEHMFAYSEGVGFTNPPVPWSELERRLSGRLHGAAGSVPPRGDGGDSPAWSARRGPYVPPPPAEPSSSDPAAPGRRRARPT